MTTSRHGLRPATDFALDGAAGRFAFFGANLFVEADAEQFQFQFLDLRRLGGGDGGEQAGDAIERAVGVVAC